MKPVSDHADVPADPDAVDLMRAQWAVVRPRMDTRPMATVGRILRVAGLADMRLRRLFVQSGIDSGGFDVLACLRRHGAPWRMTPTALYKALMLTSGAMTHRLDVLEEAGLVERKSDAQDRRGILVELTAQGTLLIDHALAARLADEADMLAPLTGKEQQQLAALLKKIASGMENDGA